MVKGQVAKLALLSAVSREGFVFKALKVYKLGFVYVDVVETL